MSFRARLRPLVGLRLDERRCVDTASSLFGPAARDRTERLSTLVL